MTLAKRIIPCLDVDAGRVVKGVQFVNIQDAGDPVEVAKRYDEQGADELVFLDISASSDGRDPLFEMVREVAAEVFIPLVVGGGVCTLKDVRRLLRAGADKISINTAAINNPDFVSAATQQFGGQCIVVAIDAKASGTSADPHWEIFTHGGRNATGIDAVAWARRMEQCGVGEILLTSMDQDGTKNGFDVALIRAVSEAVSIPVIASGGVGSLEHLVDGITMGKADAVLAASIFHFSTYTIHQAKTLMGQRGITVRM